MRLFFLGGENIRRQDSKIANQYAFKSAVICRLFWFFLGVTRLQITLIQQEIRFLIILNSLEAEILALLNMMLLKNLQTRFLPRI